MTTQIRPDELIRILKAEFGYSGGGGAVFHDVLGPTHTDTLASAVSRGSLIYGNATPKWAELALGGIAGSVLTRDANDVLWSTGGLSFAGAFTLTIPASGTAALGTGAANRGAWWSGANTITSTATWTYDGTNMVLSSGTFNCPGAGANSLRIGASSLAAGARGTAIGESASAAANECTAVGWTAIANVASGTAIGRSSRATASGATGVGYVAQATGTSSTALGANSTASGANSVACGVSANAGFASSFALGGNATTTVEYQIMMGALSYPLNDVVLYSGAGIVAIRDCATAVTNAVHTASEILAYVSTAATGSAAGFGPGLLFKGESATDGEYQPMAQTGALWAVATHASRSPLYRGTTYPLGTAGPGYWGFWTWTGIDGTSRVMIPNGTGDVTEAITIMYTVSAVTAGDAMGSMITLEPGDTGDIYSDGTDTCTITVNANGEVSVARSAGADSFDVSFLATWH